MPSIDCKALTANLLQEKPRCLYPNIRRLAVPLQLALKQRRSQKPATTVAHNSSGGQQLAAPPAHENPRGWLLGGQKNNDTFDDICVPREQCHAPPLETRPEERTSPYRHRTPQNRSRHATKSRITPDKSVCVDGR